jgi:hypothetical protein
LRAPHLKPGELVHKLRPDFEIPLWCDRDFVLQIREAAVQLCEIREPRHDRITDVLVSGVLWIPEFSDILEPGRTFPHIFVQTQNLFPSDRSTRERLLSPDPPTLHPTRQIDLTLPFQQANRTHFAQINPDGVVGKGRPLGRVMLVVLAFAEPGRIVYRHAVGRRGIRQIFFKVFELFHLSRCSHPEPAPLTASELSKGSFLQYSMHFSQLWLQVIEFNASF